MFLKNPNDYMKQVTFATYAANILSVQGRKVSNVSSSCMYPLYISFLCRLCAFGPTNAIVNIAHLFVGSCCKCSASDAKLLLQMYLRRHHYDTAHGMLSQMAVLAGKLFSSCGTCRVINQHKLQTHSRNKHRTYLLACLTGSLKHHSGRLQVTCEL